MALNISSIVQGTTAQEGVLFVHKAFSSKMKVCLTIQLDFTYV